MSEFKYLEQLKKDVANHQRCHAEKHVYYDMLSRLNIRPMIYPDFGIKNIGPIVDDKFCNQD